MSYGVTPAGFVRKPYTEILKDLRDRIRAEVGPDIDLSETQTDGQFAIVQAKAEDELWQLAEKCYYANWVSSAEGTSLDRVGEIAGAPREGAEKAIVTLEFSGDPAVTIPAGSIVATEQNVQFATIEEVTTDGSGDATVDAQAVVAGTSGIVPEDSVTVLVTPISGIDTVNNPEESSGGQEVEGDPDYRQSLLNRDTSSGSSDPGIEAALSQLAGVSVARVYSNKTLVTDSSGVPAQSMEVVVDGGLAADIYNTLYQNAPAGTNFYGANSTTITDEGGEAHVIKFSRPTEVEIYAIVNIVSNTQWDAAQIPRIKTGVVKAIGGVDTVGSVSTEYTGLSIGESVRTWKIIDAIGNEGVVGIDSIEVLVEDVDPPTEDTLFAILPRERAKIVTARVEVNVT